MGVRTVFPEIVPEKATARITADLKDHTGTAIPDTALVTLTLVLYERDTLAIVNSVGPTPVNILNAGRGTVTSAGLLTLLLDPLDNKIIGTNPVPLEEHHIALIQFTYGAGGTKAGRHEIELTVRNMDLVT